MKPLVAIGSALLLLAACSCTNKKIAAAPFDRKSWIADPGRMRPGDSARRTQVADVMSKVLKRQMSKSEVKIKLGPPNAQANGNPWSSEVAIAPSGNTSTWRYDIAQEPGQHPDVLLIGFDDHDKLVWTSDSIH